MRAGPTGASSGFLRDDGVGGSNLPLRKSSTPGAIFHADNVPTDVDPDTGDTLEPAILGRTDNAGNIIDGSGPGLRTPDIVLAGTREVWIVPSRSDIRDVDARFGNPRPKKLFAYASGTNAERTPTSIQVRDSDRNGLEDVLVSFKKDAANTNEIYRSVIYAYTDFGDTQADANTLRRRKRAFTAGSLSRKVSAALSAKWRNNAAAAEARGRGDEATPGVWVSATDGEGNTYFWNEETGESTGYVYRARTIDTSSRQQQEQREEAAGRDNEGAGP